MASGKLPALGEGGQHKRGGGHCAGEARDERRLPRKAENPGAGGENGTGDADLRAAQAEHGPAQRPQARGLELEPDQEQQQHHAELREMEDGLDFGDHGQSPKAR